MQGGCQGQGPELGRGGGSGALTKCLHRPIFRCILREHSWHWRMTVTFLDVLAFLWKMGLVWPPKPFCFLSYRRLPCATSESLPFLYWETLCSMCLLHLRQCVRTCGTLVCQMKVQYKGVHAT